MYLIQPAGMILYFNILFQDSWIKETEKMILKRKLNNKLSGYK